MTTNSDKLSITAITAKYRIQSNVVKILAQMLGVPISEPEKFPLVIENISGKILLRFDCLIPIIDTKHLIRIIDSNLNSPEDYSYYMLKTIDRTKTPPASEFITFTVMADVDHETERYDVIYLHCDYIDLRNINVFVIIYAGDDRRIPQVKAPNGYVIQGFYTPRYRVTHSLAYRKEYNLTIIKILFGDEIHDIVSDVIDNYKLKKKVDPEIQQTLSQLYSVIEKKFDRSVNGHKIYDILSDGIFMGPVAPITQRTLSQIYSEIDKNLDVFINGKSLVSVIRDVRIQIIRKYQLQLNYDLIAALKLCTWSKLQVKFKLCDHSGIGLQQITYLMRSGLKYGPVYAYQSRSVR